MGPLASQRTAPPTASRLLLFTDRPALRAFFATIDDEARVAPVAVDVARTLPLDELTAAVVDVSLEPAHGVEVCRELRRRRPDLPVAALVCCPHAVTSWSLRALLESEVSAVLDLQATGEETRRTLESVRRGAAVLHLEVRRDDGARSLRDLLAPYRRLSPTQTQLLELVALGLPDHELGRRLHLSPHTIKHRIEYLRDELCVRNRTELAAWAGRHGFYGGTEAISASSPARPF
jgi:DNA-binding NarL/FixJ family response regulator